jgi:protein gp37
VADVPFFFKQWGEWLHSSQMDAKQVDRALEIHGKNPERVHLWPDGSCSVRVSKKYAGRLLDDRKWNEFPRTP